MGKFMVGRRPVFDSNRGVHGYELLFCESRYSRPSADAMAADIFVHAGLDLGLGSLVGGKLVFIDAPRPYLVGEQPIPFPARQTVVSVPEDVRRDAEVVAGCQRLASRGYTLAIDWDAQEDDPLLPLVSMVKVEVLGLAPTELPEAVKSRPRRGVKMVAKSVETHDQLKSCQTAGFDLFEGHVLSCPEVIEGHSLSPSRLACLRIMQTLCNPRTSADDIAEMVKTDAGLSYRFLRLAGAGAGHGAYRRLSSVREGVVLVGERRLRDWVALMLLTDLHEGSDEQLNLAMTRARMAELMAGRIDPRLAEEAFTAGLVSSLDLLLNCTLLDVLKDLCLSAELEEAVLGREGVIGSILNDVLAWEVGDTGGLSSGIGMISIAETYIEALAWSTKVCGTLDG